MRIQPRQQLLETWRAVARSSLTDSGEWLWGGRQERGSISDAEQLLCLMAPATKIETFDLANPDETAEDVADALAAVGDSVELPRRLVEMIGSYLRTYSEEDGTPTFAGGGYFRSADPQCEPTGQQRELEVVDSFAMSVQLTLAILGFIRIFRSVVTRDDLRRDVEDVEAMASVRLSAAMIGLLRSFAVNVFDVDSVEGSTLCRTVNQAGQSQRRIVDQLNRELREIQAGLRDLTIAVGEPIDLDNPNRLFECGWSWGVRHDAQPVETTEPVKRQPDGVAQAAPYLYFTVVALDSIQDLFTERTRILGLLNEEQHRLARALQVRWDLTQSYWTRIASFGSGRWPLEDIPWRTTDKLESDYFTLLVTSIMVQALSGQAAADLQLGRVASVLEDLASRARITRRPFAGDPAVQLHAPGVSIPLEGSEDIGGPRLAWLASDFSPQLQKRTLRVAGLLGNAERRAQLLDLSDRIWDHLLSRRHPASQLWDQPNEVYPHLSPDDPQPSWYYTERVVEALVTAAQVVQSPPLRSPQATILAADLLAEAEHLFDQELLIASADAGPAITAVLQAARTTLRRGREILPDRPGTAFVLASEVLRELDKLTAARLSSARMS